MAGLIKAASTVDIRTATKLGITTQPSSTLVSGNALSTQPVVQVQDTSGHALLKGNIAVLASLVGTGTLGGTTTVVTDANGVATFTNLAITHSGGGTNTITFTATAAGLTSVTSNSITVTDSSFATPDIVWDDWSLTTLGAGSNVASSGGLISGRRFNQSDGTPGHITVMADPTGTKPFASPNVLKLAFAGGGDENFYINANPFGDFGLTISYGDTIWVSAWVYIDQAGSLATTADFRKIIYVNFNVNDQTHLGSLVTDQYPRNADGGPGVLAINQVGGGILIPGTGATGTVTPRAWHSWECGIKMDSAPGVVDGWAEVWYDGVNVIPRTTTHYTEGPGDANPYPSSRSVYNCNHIEIGSQLENGTGAEPRYLGPCAISTQRIGPLP